MRTLVLFSALLLAPQAQRASLPDPQQQYVVRYAVDGDTIDVGGIGRVRLLGVDAPEIGQGFDTPAPFAREARNFMTSLVVGRWVRLETDAESHDGYGRLLAYVIRDDGVDASAALLREGLARISARYPLRRLSELQTAQADAQAARRGMWGDAPTVSGETSYRVPRTTKNPKSQDPKPKSKRRKRFRIHLPPRS